MVAGFLKNLTGHGHTPYQVSRLLNSKIREDSSHKLIHVVCDIDKTYLETEFENKLSLAKIAFENAADKVTVAGATTVLTLARWGDVVNGEPVFFESKTPAAAAMGNSWPRPLHFVSSSPPQLRSVLEEKLAMDGLDWTSDTFKDQVYNLRMGRMDLLRQHVAYKSLAILSMVERAEKGSQFVLIGDSAESDAYIYLGVKLMLEGQLSMRGYLEYIERAGVESQVIGDLHEFLHAAKGLGGPGGLLGHEKKVRSIYIRQVPGYPIIEQTLLTEGILIFDGFFQVALSLIIDDLVQIETLKPILRYFHNMHGQTWEVLAHQARRVFQEWKQPGRERSDAVFQELKRLFHELGPCDVFDQPKASSQSTRGFEEPKLQPRIHESEILAAAGHWMQKLHSRKTSKP